MHAQGLRPRRILRHLALAMPPIPPSVSSHHVGTLIPKQFQGSILGLHVPLLTLQPRHCCRRRITRGRCGSLHLHRMALSSTTPYRSSRRFRDVVALLTYCNDSGSRLEKHENHQNSRYSLRLLIFTPIYSFRRSISLSPVTMRSAFPKAAHSNILLSGSSLNTLTR